MIRLQLLFMGLAVAACGFEAAPVNSAAASPPLLRGGSAEVRLRCGSDTLRAKLRQGQLIAQLEGGENKVLNPVDDPRAGSGPAFSDGRLTLYRLPEARSWSLAKGGSPATQCLPEEPLP